jgi:hypothetical protein
MSEVTEVATKSKTEYTAVQMQDGRTVQFAGKRKMSKDVLVDESKIDSGDGVVQFQQGAISVRFDFVNGQTRTITPSVKAFAKAVGHGISQKAGDECASTVKDPMSVEDMVLAIEEIGDVLAKGDWGKERAAGTGSMAGASNVILAIIEATSEGRVAKGLAPMTVADVKAMLQKKLDADPELTHAALYKAFKAPGSKTGVIIRRMEEEKAAKGVKVDTDALLADA